MTDRQTRNVTASIRQRLMNHARESGDDFQYVLTRYGLERLLYRLSCSPHANTFVLKGAILFQLWSDQPHRPTRDVDLLGCGDPSAVRFEAMFRDVCSTAVEEDGLAFLPESVRAQQIKDEDEYQGIRLRVDARLSNARIPLQVDIGFGDAVTPGAIDVQFPTLLDHPAPMLRAYPRETVIAEKFQAMVMLGIANSRMKDFYDLWVLARQFSFDGRTICDAIRATFARRQTALPQKPPLALTPEFSQDRNKAIQWQAFLAKGRLVTDPPDLATVIVLLDSFLMPPILCLAAAQPFAMRWMPNGPWQE